METTKPLLDRMVDRIKNEPIAVMASIEAFVYMVSAFGLHMTHEQTFSILALVGTVLTLIARKQVKPTRKLPEELRS